MLVLPPLAFFTVITVLPLMAGLRVSFTASVKLPSEPNVDECKSELTFLGM